MTPFAILFVALYIGILFRTYYEDLEFQRVVLMQLSFKKVIATLVISFIFLYEAMNSLPR